MNNIIIQIIVLGAILLLYNYRKQIHRYLNRLMNNDDRDEIFQKPCALENAFDALNIEYKKDLDDEGNVLYMFKYQAGEFYMRYNEAATSMQLTFPYITDAEVDKIDLVRTACNDVNGVTPMTSAVYKVDVEGDTYKINIHIIAGLPRLSDLKEMVHTLRYTLKDCFHLRSMFCSHLKDIIEASNREQADDIEYEMAKSHDATVAADGITTLGEWLANCDIMPQSAQIQQIVCEGDDGYHFTSKDIDTITSYRLTEPIVHQLGADNTPTAETASIKIIFTIGEEADSNKHTVIVALEKAATIDKDKVTYIRINYVTSNRAATSTATRIPAEVAVTPKAGSMTIGFDWTTGKNKQAEFDYMWADARDKERDGHRDEWTAEQKLIHDLTDPTLAYNMYWGYKLMLQKRFYEASQHFEYVWRQNNEHIKRNGEKSHAKWQKFYNTCLMLGTCYLNIGQYYKAFYYLQNLEGCNDHQAVRTIIACFMGAKDYRAQQAIENCQTQIEERIKELTQTEQEVPPYLLDLYHFIKRNSVIFNIENAHYDEAEKSCKEMLKNSDEKDFALDSLAKIQSLRNEGKALPAESQSTSSDTQED